MDDISCIRTLVLRKLRLSVYKYYVHNKLKLAMISIVIVMDKACKIMQDLTKHKEKIEQITADMNCPKDFECYKSGFDNLCKAKDNGIDGYAACLEDDINCNCGFRIRFGHGVLCHCPLRVYVAKNIEK